MFRYLIPGGRPSPLPVELGTISNVSLIVALTPRPASTVFHVPHHPGCNSGANRKSISHRCHPILVAFVKEWTEETINLPLGCLQGGSLDSGVCFDDANAARPSAPTVLPQADNAKDFYLKVKTGI